MAQPHFDSNSQPAIPPQYQDLVNQISIYKTNFQNLFPAFNNPATQSSAISRMALLMGDAQNYITANSSNIQTLCQLNGWTSSDSPTLEAALDEIKNSYENFQQKPLNSCASGFIEGLTSLYYLLANQSIQ
jgi:hypothetical protein